jgi:Domain of unknown function (DUF4304)
LRESHYGRFTVNLGVALPAVRALESGREFPVLVQEYECDIRQRLTRLAFNEDAWFDLKPPSEQDRQRYHQVYGFVRLAIS